MIELDLADPKRRWRQLFADLRYLLNVGYPRLLKGEKWGDWTIDKILEVGAKIFNALRSVYFPLIPPKPGEEGYDTSFWQAYREMEKRGLIEIKPPETEEEVLHWDELRKRIIEDIKPERGLYLVEDQAYAFWTGEKKLLVKSEPFDISDPVYLLDKNYCYGIISFSEPRKITTVEEWNKIKRDAYLSDQQIWAWWRVLFVNGKLSKPLYVYEVKDFERWDPPKGIQIPKGIQTFVKAENITWVPDKPFKPPVLLFRASESDYIQFLGTKGLIEEANENHKYHTSILLNIDNTRVLIDWGEKHPDPPKDLDGIIITHTHPDHFCEDVFKLGAKIYSVDIPDTERVEPGRGFSIGNLKFVMYPVLHSIKSPNYAVLVNDEILIITDYINFRSSDVKHEIFEKIKIAIIDGSSYSRDIIRHNEEPFGHSSVKRIINDLPEDVIIFITHVGKEIVEMGDAKLQRLLREEFPERKIFIPRDGDIYFISDLKMSFNPEFAMKLAKKISELKETVLIPEFIVLTGSTIYARDHPPRDLDILVKAEICKNNEWHIPLKTPFFLKVNRGIAWAMKELTGKPIEPSYPPPNPYGANFPYIPIADLVIKFRKPFLVIPDEEEFGERVYGIDLKEAVTLRVKTKDTEKMAQQSLEEDKIVPGRFFVGLKPVRPPKEREERQTPESVLELIEKYPVFVSEKRDGMRCMLHKIGDEIIIYSEDGSDITEDCPNIVKEAKKLPVEKLVLDGEVEGWERGIHHPREWVAGTIHSAEKDDTFLVFNCFDILYHSDYGDLHNEPFYKRYEILKSLPIKEKEGPLDEKIKFYIIPHHLCKNEKELLREIERIRKIYGSEGVVIKAYDSIYPLDGKPDNNDWIKFHNNVVFRGIVIEPVQTKVPTVYNLYYGVLLNGYECLPKDREEVGPYENVIAVGSTFAAPYVRRGAVIEVEAETINLVYREDKKSGDIVPIELRAWAPRFMREVPGGKPDTVDDIVKKAKEEHVLQIKVVHPDKSVSFEIAESKYKESIVAFFSDGMTLDSNVVSRDKAKYLILYDTSTAHYEVKPVDYVGDEIDYFVSSKKEDDAFVFNGTINQFLELKGWKLKETEDPFSMHLDENKTHKFIFQTHYRVALYELLKKIGREDLWKELTAEEWEEIWDDYWKEVRSVLEEYFKKHPRFTHSPSVHLDFRFELDIDACAGWTLMVQLKNKPKVPPLYLYKREGPFSAEEFELDESNWKINWITGEIPRRIKKGGAVAPVSIVSRKKAGFIPKEWFSLEGIFPPKSIPATARGYALMRVVRTGIIETGYITEPYAKEYFLTFPEENGLKGFRWRIMFRYLRKPFAEGIIEWIE